MCVCMPECVCVCVCKSLSKNFAQLAQILTEVCLVESFNQFVA